MRIRTSLIISMVFFAAAMLVISAFVISTNQQIVQLHEQEAAAKNVELKVSELGYLSNDYILYRESQQVDRWESKYSSIYADLSNLTVTRPDQQVLVDNIKANGRRLREIFYEVVSSSGDSSEVQPSAVDPELIQISWSRMAVQSQGMIFDASRLSQMLREQADQMERRNEMLIFALIGAFIAFLLTDFLLIYRRTLTSISNLQAGTKIIGEGNLDHSIDEEKSDEFGELASAFNLMTQNLKSITASKADLEREVAVRKAAEEALRSSEAELRSLFAAMTDIVIVLDAQGRYLKIAPTNPSLLYLPASEMIGKTLHEVFPHHLADTYLGYIRQVIDTRQLMNVEYDMTIGNNLVWFAATISPMADDCVLLIARDITERKRIEEDLRKAKVGLEQRVLERTEDLQRAKIKLEAINDKLVQEIQEHTKTEAELLKAKEAAEAALKTKALFLANMSHELRTPMNAVIGFTGLLLDEPMTSEQKECLTIIRDSGEALLALINDLLDFSRMEREDAEIEYQPFDLRSIVEESLDQVSTQAAKKNLDLAYSIDNAVPDTVVGDPARLRQILINLLSNAVKYTEKGEAVLCVSSRGEDEILFEVKDTGIGIPEDKVDIIFQPFSRVDESFSSRYEGAGLGLAISKKLALMMGGRIWVESVPGKGSTFFFTIKARMVPGKSGSIPTGIQPQLEGKHVLIVDDSIAVRRIIGKQLHSWGIIPVIKPSGQEALDLIRAGAPFDAAILDASLGDMDDFALAREIRKYKGDMPLILLSHAGQKGDPELFNAALIKPVKPKQLYKVLLQILAAQSPSPPSAAQIQRPDASPGRSPMRILLAEDNTSNQRVTLRMLRKLGYRADAVANGAEAIQALERQSYDLILMDIKMPVMGGIEAARMIRERWPDNGPRIVAITAYALEGDRERCLAAGMDDYIAKPVQSEELMKVLDKYR